MAIRYLKPRANRRELGRLRCLHRNGREKACYKKTFGSTQQVLMFRNNIIFVFIQKLIRLVLNLKQGKTKNEKAKGSIIKPMIQHFIEESNASHLSSIMSNSEITTR